MILGGIQPFTMIDYPDKLAAVFFTKGCPLRCPYCQNPTLQELSDESTLQWSVARSFMESRRKLLDAIVFSGGEPLIQKDLKGAMLEAKELGFLVGLHTSGVSLSSLENVISVVDWVGLDIKTLFNKYEERIPNSRYQQVKGCLDLLLQTRKDFEVRTTLDPRVIKKDELLMLASDLSGLGIKNYAIQEYHAFQGEKNPPDPIAVKSYFKEDFIKELKSLFNNLIVRRS